jgi:hypothetical protein
VHKERVVCGIITFCLLTHIGEDKELGTPFAIMRQTNGKTLFSGQLLRTFITGMED